MHAGGPGFDPQHLHFFDKKQTSVVYTLRIFVVRQWSSSEIGVYYTDDTKVGVCGNFVSVLCLHRCTHTVTAVVQKKGCVYTRYHVCIYTLLSLYVCTNRLVICVVIV